MNSITLLEVGKTEKQVKSTLKKMAKGKTMNGFKHKKINFASKRNTRPNRHSIQSFLYCTLEREEVKCQTDTEMITLIKKELETE
jgi:hypothetical protein